MELIEKLKKIKELLDTGLINESEFQKLKDEVLNSIDKGSGRKNTVDTIQESKNPERVEKLNKKSKTFRNVVIGVLLVSIISILGYFFFLPNEKTLVPYLKANGKYVFVDSATMKVKITTEYDNATLFKEGFSLVKKNEKYFFLDKKGQTLASDEFEDAHDFKDGFAAVKKSGKWSFINNAGNKICEFIYEDAHDFKDGFAKVNSNNKWGVINKQGKEIILCQFDYLSDFSEGYFIVTYAGNPYKYAYIDTLGNEKRMFQYDIIQDFHNGIAQVGKYWTQPNGGDFYDDEIKYGFIDSNFNQIINLQYLNCSEYEEGLLAVKKNSKWGYVDVENKTLIPFQFDDYASVFKNGIAIVTLNYKNGIINTKGDFVIRCVYDEIRLPNDGLLAYRDAEKWGYLNINGGVVIKAQYEPLDTNELGFHEIGDFIHGFAKVRLNQKYFFIDKTGREYREQ